MKPPIYPIKISASYINKSKTVIIVIFIILVMVSFQPTLLKVAEQDLGFHMILEHTLFFLVGYLSVQISEIMLRLLVSSSKKTYVSKDNYLQDKNLESRISDLRKVIVFSWTKLLKNFFRINQHCFVWVIIAVTLMIFWHIPSIFDYAQLHETTHILQHLSFIAIGMTCFLASRTMGEPFNLFTLFSLGAIMGLVGLFFTVLSTPVYQVYSMYNHNITGSYMIIMCLLMLIVGMPSYLIYRTLYHIRIKSDDRNTKSKI
jgi:cytochrome c oxidase assembly factor CtaG